jgi:glutathione-regulated potassium-efflux system ancillary protein KefC
VGGKASTRGGARKEVTLNELARAYFFGRMTIRKGMESPKSAVRLMTPATQWKRAGVCNGRKGRDFPHPPFANVCCWSTRSRSHRRANVRPFARHSRTFILGEEGSAMTQVWALAALWLGLALIASLLSIWLRISSALSEIVVGTIAQSIVGAAVGSAMLGTSEFWVTFLSGLGAIVLTFLAGAELDPQVFKLKWKEAAAIGVASFLFPFVACATGAYYLLGWQPMPSWLAGVAMSTTSVAVVYAVMLEFGFNATDYGKTVLAACFVTDLGTVVALGLIFAPFTFRTLIFLGTGVVVFVILPWLTPRFFRLYGNRPSELETKFLLLCLLGMGALASWADSEAVLPAYLIGMVLAGTVGKDHALVRRLRTLTFGLLTPFYFIRAGSFVSIPALVAAPIRATRLEAASSTASKKR